MAEKEIWQKKTPDVKSRWPVHLEPKDDIMNKPLIVNVAPAGTHIDRNQNPNQPYYPEEILKEVKDCFDLGASMTHIHVRDKATEKASVEPELLRDSMEMIREKCKGILISMHVDFDHSKTDRGMILETVEGLVKLNCLPDTVVFHTATKTSRKVFEAGLIDQVQYVESLGMKSELQCQNFIGIDNIKRWLIQKEIPKKPYFVNHHIGKHETVPLSFPSPWNFITAMSMLQLYPPQPGSVVGLYAGGRNWLPVAVMGIMLGVDAVRPGMEDAVYMHPHSEEKITSNASMVEKIVTIADRLGRKIATPAETRKILDLDSM